MPDPRLAAMGEPSEADRLFVEEAMTRSGLTPSEEEFARLTKSYLMLRAGADALYAVPEARYEVPALVFDPAPSFEDWGGS